MLVPRDGCVYHLPNAGGTGYVGKSKKLAERLRRHDGQDIDTSGSSVLYRGTALDEYEAYYIGYLNTYEAGMNENRGNSRKHYAQGQQRARAEGRL